MFHIRALKKFYSYVNQCMMSTVALFKLYRFMLVVGTAGVCLNSTSA
jgi:hypothetical protein